MAPPTGSSKIAKRRPLQNVSASNASTKVSGKAGVVLVNGTVVKKGSKYCMIEGCTSRAKHARRCWRHGGSVKCKVPDCANRAKTKGVCWSHGGGTLCSFRGCTTISVSNGVCWAHGGGKRCAMEGCARPAYERTDHLCTLHFEEKQYITQVHSHNTQCHQHHY
ncbi:WRKY transcription factor 19 [Phytophthora nicotianae]|nr:WRKY transcription factor 19 [Phytophthora nicotianae]KUF98707.1 Glutathione peroxidase [Phytophthora nicotianae]